MSVGGELYIQRVERQRGKQYFAWERVWEKPNHKTAQKLWYSLYNTHFTLTPKRDWEGRSNASPSQSHNHPISQLIRDYSCKDDVTDILLLGISYMHITEEDESGRPTLLTSLRVMH
jgi:hypothetical protein